MNTVSSSWGGPVFSSRVVPVVVITDVRQAVPLARALLDGGIDVIEITLRHAAGLPTIEAVARQVPQMQVGAGTVTRAVQMQQARDAGARFALSPGWTEALVQASRDAALPFIPGVMTPSEVLQARDLGFGLLKLFPAAQAGGVGMLKALAGPLPEVQFCPTGGVSPGNMAEYLRLPNVAMVGGSWLTPVEALEQGRWADIRTWTRQACEQAAAASAAASTREP